VPAEDQDWYLVFRNTARRTRLILDFSIAVSTVFEGDKVEIVTPETMVFAHPMIVVGDTVNISGVATDDVQVEIDGAPLDVMPGEGYWFVEWNTSGKIPGEYGIHALCGGAEDERLIELLDPVPPVLDVNSPDDGEIIEADSLNISGICRDNTEVVMVEVRVDDEDFQEAIGTDTWYLDWDISGLALGDHTISVRATDNYNGVAVEKVSFVYNESGHEWSPVINLVYHDPEDPTNTSNIRIYANVTQGSPYMLSQVFLYCENASMISVYELYRYGDYPVQPRHEEDPLRNESNDPIYGYELGQIHSGEVIIYWIVAIDTAQNKRISDEYTLMIN
jgi:hypothetical protein